MTKLNDIGFLEHLQIKTLNMNIEKRIKLSTYIFPKLVTDCLCTVYLTCDFMIQSGSILAFFKKKKIIRKNFTMEYCPYYYIIAVFYKLNKTSKILCSNNL